MLVISRHDNSVKIKPQTTGDLWHLEKIIKKWDFVTATSTRKFVTDSGKQERKPVTIKLEVDKVSFHKPSGTLRVLGIIIEGKPEEFVQLKSHHSLEVGYGEIIKIEKQEWQKYEIDRLKEAEKSSKMPKIHVLIMDERNAELFVIKEYGFDSLGSAVSHGRGKYTNESSEIKNKFYTEIFDMLQLNSIEKLVIAGSGFEKDNFLNFLKDKRFKAVVSTISINNTGKQGLNELLQSDAIDKVLKESRLAVEVKLIEELIVEIAREGNVTYGFDEVEKALDVGAVDKLLILDSLVFEDKRIENLIKKAEQTGVKVFLISHENEESEKLKALSGVAALLRYKAGM